MTDPIRLSKRLAELLPCSRREAELYIEGGWVLVDGQVVEEPQFKVADQRIELLPGATPAPIEPATLLLHKPAGLDEAAALALLAIASRADDDSSGIRPVKRHFRHLSAPLPLDTDASGLLVFSQHRGVLRKLSEDADRLEQEFIVEVSGQIAGNGLARLHHGLSYRGVALAPCKVSWQSENRLRFALKAPRCGQIRHMCESVGLQVLGQKRIRIGRLAMAKLPSGRWRFLGAHERF